MRVGLVAYNWEADTSLALWNLELSARQHPRIAREVEFVQLCSATPKSLGQEEQMLFEVLRWVRQGGFDLLGFSCYVWNMRFVNRVAKAVKVLCPATTILYGGQQIKGSYIPYVFEHERCVDVCVDNEAEISFPQLILHYLTGKPELSEIPGIAYPNGDGTVHHTGQAEVVADLNDIPSPYLGDVDLPYGGAYLYEASRGCPYRCSFCIWGETNNIREYDMERVEREIATILNRQPSHIMFCDGTFNLRSERAEKILGILVEHLRDGRVRPFSLLLEQKLELIKEGLVAVLDELVSLNPLVALEFGLQSASQKAAKLMRRPFSQKRFRAAWDRLTPRLKSMAVLDCIYGLPGDGIEEFKQTVDFAYSLAPQYLQIFRLGVLPGSQFDRQAAELGLKFSPEPAHMLYESEWLTLDDMMWLELFGFAAEDLYHFHAVTVRCLLGASDHFPSFSALVSDFVDHEGQAGIFGSLREKNQAQGRFRAIDLSNAFQSYVMDRALPVMGLDDPQIRRRFREVLIYESTLGNVAIRGLPLKSTWDGLGEEPVELLESFARVLKTPYDIPSFVRGNRVTVSTDIRQLAERETVIAISQKAGKNPISYRISDKAAQILARFEGGRSMERALAELTRDGGPGEARWRRAIDKLQGTGLLVKSPSRETLATGL